MSKIPLNAFQKAFLTVGSGIAAFIKPQRADLIATFGELSAAPFTAKQMVNTMLSSPVGRKILRERPRVTENSININALRSYPVNTFGRHFADWMDREKVTPNTRLPVRFILNDEEAYAVQRYRECHDFYHAIADLPVLMEGEVPVKAMEFANLKVPMTGLACFSEPFKHGKAMRNRLLQIYLPWGLKTGFFAPSLLNVYWEKLFAKDLNNLRNELRISPPPDIRELRRLAKAGNNP